MWSVLRRQTVCVWRRKEFEVERTQKDSAVWSLLMIQRRKRSNIIRWFALISRSSFKLSHGHQWRLPLTVVSCFALHTIYHWFGFFYLRAEAQIYRYLLCVYQHWRCQFFVSGWTNLMDNQANDQRLSKNELGVSKNRSLIRTFLFFILTRD